VCECRCTYCQHGGGDDDDDYVDDDGDDDDGDSDDDDDADDDTDDDGDCDDDDDDDDDVDDSGGDSCVAYGCGSLMLSMFSNMSRTSSSILRPFSQSLKVENISPISDR
jgi:hypothetical protein